MSGPDTQSDTASNILPLYEANAKNWSEKRAARLAHHPWLDRALALVPDAPRILDLGCGNGRPIARYLTERGAQVTGIDGAPAMIDEARRFAPQGDWRLADMRRLDMHQRFDGVIAWNSFFHLTPDEQRAMFPIFARHTHPGAPLMFTAGPEHGVTIGEMWGQPLYHASLDPDEYRTRLSEAGFAVVHYVPEDPEWNRHSVWLAQRV